MICLFSRDQFYRYHENSLFTFNDFSRMKTAQSLKKYFQMQFLENLISDWLLTRLIDLFDGKIRENKQSKNLTIKKSMFTCHSHFLEFHFLLHSIVLMIIVVHSSNGFVWNKIHYCLFSTMKKQYRLTELLLFLWFICSLSNVIDWLNALTNRKISSLEISYNHAHAFGTFAILSLELI